MSDNELRIGIATVSDLTNIVRTSAEQAVSFEFIDALDRALLEIVSGARGPDAAIRDAVNTIARTESSVTYTSATGQQTRAKVYGATRRAVMSGSNATTLRMQEARLKEVGAKDVEVTSHFGARPEHALWQGRVYKFKKLTSATGYGTGAGLGGWNCKHSWFPFIRGISEKLPKGTLPSDAQNAEQYALSQRQRLAERNVRQYQTRSNIYGDAAGAGTGDIEEWARGEQARNTGLANRWRAEADRVASQRTGARRSSAVGGAAGS